MLRCHPRSQVAECMINIGCNLINFRHHCLLMGLQRGRAKVEPALELLQLYVTVLPHAIIVTLWRSVHRALSSLTKFSLTNRLRFVNCSNRYSKGKVLLDRNPCRALSTTYMYKPYTLSCNLQDMIENGKSKRSSLVASTNSRCMHGHCLRLKWHQN